MIIETINVHGSELIINFNYITKIEHTTVHNPNGHPCCGEKGDSMIKVSVAHSAVYVFIACDYDGNDLTEPFLKAYKAWGYRATQ